MADKPIYSNNLTSEDRGERYQPRRQRGGGSDVFITFLLVLALAGIGALGWMSWQQHQALATQNAQLVAAQQTIATLQAQISNTDETITASSEETDDALKVWESETRKLWDLVNKRVRPDVTANERAIGAAVRANEDTNKLIASVQSQLGDLERSITTLTRQQQSLADTVNSQTTQLTRTSATLQQSVDENIRAISAIDASRAQNNARILDLVRRLSALENN